MSSHKNLYNSRKPSIKLIITSSRKHRATSPSSRQRVASLNHQAFISFRIPNSIEKSRLIVTMTRHSRLLSSPYSTSLCHRQHWIPCTSTRKRSTHRPSMTLMSDESTCGMCASSVKWPESLRQTLGSSSYRRDMVWHGVMCSKRPAQLGCIILIFSVSLWVSAVCVYANAELSELFFMCVYFCTTRSRLRLKVSPADDCDATRVGA